MRSLWWVLALASCGDREAASQVVAPTAIARSASLDAAAATPATPAKPPLRAPHGAAIAMVALTDAGDAALTVDEQDRVRLWPTLDGKREPVVVRAPSARQLALVRDRDELVAAVLDEVGGLELIRHDASGGLRGRARVTTEPAIVQIVAAGGGVLARRGDHTVLWIDRLARVRGTLVPEPGEQLVTIVARRDSAVAAIANPEHGAVVAVRRIELRGGVRWGARIALPEQLTSALALSPSGKRIVGVAARWAMQAVVIELGPPALVLVRETVMDSETERIVGFLDENRLVLPGGAGFEIGKHQPQSDPWADTGDRSHLRFARGGAVADRIVVSPAGTALALATPDTTSFLGYRDLGIGSLRRTADGTTLVAGDRVLWLDDKLRITRTSTLNASARSTQVLVLDASHAVRAVWEQPNAERGLHRLVLIDTDTAKEHDLGTWPGGTSIAYDARTHVLINAADPHSDRLQLDLATGTVKLLRPLKTWMYPVIEPIDPTLSDGVSAVAYMPNVDGGYAIATYTDDGKGGRKPLAPATKVKLGDASVLGIDRRGVTWTLSSTAPRIVRAYKKGKRVAKFSVPSTVHAGVITPDGGTLFAIDPAQVIALDTRGAERWRAPAWRATMASASADGAVYLYTQGGLITLDGATGHRLATGCAWGFGLSRSEPNQSVFSDSLVCAEGGE